MKQKKRAGKSIVYYYLKGMLPSLVVSMILICILAFISTKKDIPAQILPWFLIGFGGIGSFIYACATAKNHYLRGIVNGVLSSLIFSGVFIVICLVCSGFSLNTIYLIMIAVDLLLGCTGSIFMKNIRKK